jgi:beta-1,4-mannosyltransferase
MIERRVAVVVLGDLGRSPRMQYHALALADDGAEVDLIGYAGRPPERAVAEHARIRVHRLAPPLRHRAPPALFAPAAAADLALQSGGLFARLAMLARPSVVLVQNPPSLPTLPVARLAAALRGARLVIDWHNFGADMLALRLGATHPAVRAAEAVERAFGRSAHAHLCVSAAMRAVLERRFGVPGARVLYDRPARRAERPDAAARAALLDRLGLPASATTRVLVTSSSWSDDEDFALLVEAAARLDAGLGPSDDVLLVMTGDGPRRAHWEARFAAAGLRRVRPRTLWVASEDYPRLLGAADLGLSLHRSASGVDLPMKIADMFGAGLPVLALAYGPVLSEMVTPGETGRLFTSADELAADLAALLAAPAALEALRRGVARAAAQSWQDGWNHEARAVFWP